MAVGCSLLILAGGKSRRMGRDKAVLPVGSATMVEHIARRLSPVVDEVLLAGRQSSAGRDGMKVVADRFLGQGPLAGMHTGFLAASQPLVWVVACDLPDVEPGLLPLLLHAQGADAVVPRVGDRAQGLCALYQRALSTRIESLLHSGLRSLHDLLGVIDVNYLEEGEIRSVDPELRSFRNLNTPADYEAWLSAR